MAKKAKRKKSDTAVSIFRSKLTLGALILVVFVIEAASWFSGSQLSGVEQQFVVTIGFLLVQGLLWLLGAVLLGMLVLAALKIFENVDKEPESFRAHFLNGLIGVITYVATHPVTVTVLVVFFVVGSAFLAVLRDSLAH